MICKKCSSYNVSQQWGNEWLCDDCGHRWIEKEG